MYRVAEGEQVGVMYLGVTEGEQGMMYRVTEGEKVGVMYRVTKGEQGI